MMNIISFILTLYSNNRDCILWSLFVILVITFLIVRACFKRKKYLFNKVIQKIFSGIIVVLFGTILKILGISLKVDCSYFNVIIFLIVIFLLGLYFIFQLLIYGNKISIIVHLFQYLLYVFYVELFLLSNSMSLDCLEFLVFVSLIICLDSILLYLKSAKKEDKIITKESDNPNFDLLYQRKNQLDKFIGVLDAQMQEPYAIMINAKWGMGKTSFVKALERRLNDYTFIWIDAGTEKSVDQLMIEISLKIIQILKENNIFIESDGLIENYFKSFSDIIQESKFKFINHFISNYSINNDISDKNYINSKLRELKNPIYLIIDDLDRCSEEYQDKAYKVLRESTNLTNCKTIFLVDKEQLSQKDINYLEKYNSYTLNLCEVEYVEIVYYFFKEIFQDDFFESVNKIIINNKNTAEIKEMILKLTDKILEEIKTAKENLENEDVRNVEIRQDTNKKLISKYDKILNTIKKNTKNVRKVKRFLKSIKYSIEFINTGMGDISVEFQKKEWIEYILRVQFLKSFLPEVYGEIRKCIDIEHYIQKDGNHHIKCILNLDNVLMSKTDLIILNELLYREEVITYSELKTDREKYMKELHSYDVKIQNVNKYIEYFETYDDLCKIIEICKKQEDNYFEGREEFIKNLFKNLSNRSMIYNLDISELFSISMQIIKWLEIVHLSNQEKNIIQHYSELIIRRVLVDNSHFLRNILFIFFDVTKVQNIWETLSVSNISEFYEILKQIDSNFENYNIKNEKDKFSHIKMYYKNCLEELHDDKFKSINIDVSSYEATSDKIFEVCEIWLNIEELLNDKYHMKDIAKYRYFDIETFNYNEDTFLKVENLEIAVIELIDFYNSKQGCYKSDYSLLLMRIAHRIIELFEEKKEWFEGKENEIGDLLLKASALVCQFDPLECKESKQIIEQLKVFVFKFISSY